MLLFALVSLGILCILVNEVIIKPFPFLDLDYVDILNWESTPRANKSYGHLNVEAIVFSPKLEAEIEEKLSSPVFAKVLWAVEITRYLQRCSVGQTIRNLEEVFSQGDQFCQICSESSKIFVALVEVLGLPARVIWMNGHTTAEVYHKDKWIMIDAYGNVMAENEEGRYLSTQEIISCRGNYTFVKILKDCSDGPRNFLDSGYFENPHNPYAKQNLLVTINNGDLFGLEQRAKSILSAASSFFGLKNSAVASGAQLVLSRHLVGNVGVRIARRLFAPV